MAVCAVANSSIQSIAKNFMGEQNAEVKCTTANMPGQHATVGHCCSEVNITEHR
jgi:hypothetical protein